ncbi:MAG: hypothetical protein NVSMB45_10990 [Ginsengibacter sp.]
MKHKGLSLSLFIYLGFINQLNAQVTIKRIPATRTTAAIKIDGTLSEPAWKTAQPFSDFTEFKPKAGAKENFETRTEVWMLYDNTAIYIGGYCHERTKDSVSRELVGRDKIGSSDFCGIIVDTYNDKINGSEFFVTPYGEQYDAKVAPPDPNSNNNNGGEDNSWNAVWESEARVVADGWTFEMRIPYSALRFSSKDLQTWGLNVMRRRSKTQQQFTWNPLDVNKNGLMNQEGEWTGIENIKAPLRLAFSPYFSTYINRYPYNTKGVKDYTSSVNGGMDVKYGINSSFTLDMTLIPDFGQVQSDNRILNLTPFEVKYNENRPFFTEGTELFNKGSLFYSRRVGGTPLHYGDLSYNANEHIVLNPTESKLINATKISGRTAKGLGIGFFNAITRPMFATVEDDKGNTREIQTSPLTNYNIFVLNQSLKNNSGLSFVNTSTIRKGNDYNADVAAVVYEYNDKKAMYSGYGKTSISNLSYSGGKNVTGYSHSLNFGKSGGMFNWNVSQQLVDEKYDINDLGILFNNNFLEHDFYLGGRWTKPTKWYNSIYLNHLTTYISRYNPSTYQSFQDQFNVNGQLKNLMYFELNAGFNAPANDFYEPRVQNRFYKTSSAFSFGAFINTNQSKKFQTNGGLMINTAKQFDRRGIMINMRNSYRFTDKFSIGLQTNYHPIYNDAGYADVSGNDIIFSRRDVMTVENIFNMKYNFNKKSGITFRARHYWSKVQPLEFFTLANDGNLSKNNTYTTNLNNNLNIFNIDMVYTWEFAPGSFVNVVYKNSAFTGDQLVYNNYVYNFKNTLNSPQNNNLSFKIIYYLDYLKLKKGK